VSRASLQDGVTYTGLHSDANSLSGAWSIGYPLDQALLTG